MEKNFLDYLKKINASDIVIDQVDKIYNECKILYNIVNVTDIFVTDFFDKNQEREWGNLWFFNDEFVIEAKDFMTARDIDYSSFKNKIIYCDIKYSNFDLINTNDKSFLKLYVRLNNNLISELFAVKENCNFLIYIFKKYFYPNIIK